MVAASEMVSDPAASPRPVRNVVLDMSRKNCPPMEVRLDSVGLSWNRAVAPRSTEVWEIWARLSVRTPSRFWR